MRCGAVRCGAVRCNTARCGARRSVVRGTVHHGNAREQLTGEQPNIPSPLSLHQTAEAKKASAIPIATIVTASAGVCVVLAITSCLVDRFGQGNKEQQQVAAEREEVVAGEREMQDLLDQAREREDVAFNKAADQETLVSPRFKSAPLEKEYLEYSLEQGFPRLKGRLASFFLPLSLFVAAVLYLLTNELDGTGGGDRTGLDLERRLTLALLLITVVPVWSAFRFCVGRTALSGETFHLYANAVAHTWFLVFLAAGSIQVRYGAPFATVYDWALRGVMAFFLVSVPRLSEQRTLSVTVQSIFVAVATEVVCSLSLTGVQYKCRCNKTFDITRVDMVLTHVAFWTVAIVTACEFLRKPERDGQYTNRKKILNHAHALC